MTPRLAALYEALMDRWNWRETEFREPYPFYFPPVYAEGLTWRWRVDDGTRPRRRRDVAT